VGLASRGQRDMDGGIEVISDVAELARVRRQGREVHVKSLLLAAALVTLLLLIPPFR